MVFTLAEDLIKPICEPAIPRISGSWKVVRSHCTIDSMYNGMLQHGGKQTALIKF